MIERVEYDRPYTHGRRHTRACPTYTRLPTDGACPRKTAYRWQVALSAYSPTPCTRWCMSMVSLYHGSANHHTGAFLYSGVHADPHRIPSHRNPPVRPAGTYQRAGTYPRDTPKIAMNRRIHGFKGACGSHRQKGASGWGSTPNEAPYAPLIGCQRVVLRVITIKSGINRLKTPKRT